MMKTGGLHHALKICNMAEIYGVECMIGCMLESKVSVNAAVHLAAAKRVITKIDLDGPALSSEDPIIGGSIFESHKITLAMNRDGVLKNIGHSLTMGRFCTKILITSKYRT